MTSIVDLAPSVGCRQKTKHLNNECKARQVERKTLQSRRQAAQALNYSLTTCLSVSAG